MLVLYLEDIQKDDEPRGRATLHRRAAPRRNRDLQRRPDLAIPTCLRSYQECDYLSGCSADFFPPTDCPTVDLGLPNSSGLRALYSLVLRMLPTRLNGSLVRACTRLLRLLAATCCSWHSYLNVISMFLRTARSYPCTHYMASPIPISHFNRHPTAVNSVGTITILSRHPHYEKFKETEK